MRFLVSAMGGAPPPLVFPEGGHPPHGKKGEACNPSYLGSGGASPPTRSGSGKHSSQEGGREPLPIRDPTTHQAQDALGEVVGRADGVLTRVLVG